MARLVTLRKPVPTAGIGLTLTGNAPVSVSDVDFGLIQHRRSNHAIFSLRFSDSPAERAGLRVGDIVLEVDGHSCVTAAHGLVVQLLASGLNLQLLGRLILIFFIAVARALNFDTLHIPHVIITPANVAADSKQREKQPLITDDIHAEYATPEHAPAFQMPGSQHNVKLCSTAILMHLDRANTGKRADEQILCWT